MDDLVNELFQIGCIKFGEFLLKSGLKSPIYFDLRLLVSYPKLLKLASSVLSEKLLSSSIDYDLLCGVPYGAVSLATAVSLETGKPMIFKRKEAKAHGTGKLIEGIYKNGESCLVVDDVITSGVSIWETVQDLRAGGLKVTDAIVLLDREQGGEENLNTHDIQLHSLLKTQDVLDRLRANESIDQTTYDKTVAFLNANKHVAINKNPSPSQELDFESRAMLCKNKVGKRLFEIMALKQTNLCFSADYFSFDQLIKAADEAGPHICMIKTHVDMCDDFDMDKLHRLIDLSNKHKFLIFEDRKFADIGQTVKSQYTQGIYKISQWAHIVNAHAITGPGCLSGLKDGLEDSAERACLLIAQLSSKGNLIDENYIKKTVEMAEANADFVIGFICQKKLSKNASLLHMAPGIQIREDDSLSMSDKLGQQYTTPDECIEQNGCDLVIVGRGIMNAKEGVKSAAQRYQQVAYQSYLKRVKCVN